MLRISTIDSTDDIVLRIEGKLIKPWTMELESVWRDLALSLRKRKLVLDIRNTISIDEGGFECLARIAQSVNTGVLADNPLTRQFADRIEQMKVSKDGRKQ